MKRTLRILAAIGSGGLLALAFEPFGQAEAAWFALVPALLAFRFSPTPRRAAGLGLLCGFVFWMVVMYWFRGLAASQEANALVILLAQGSLSFWCALFFVPVAVFTQAWFCRFDGRDKGMNMAFIFLGAILWVGFEWLRAVLLSGFPWNPLAVSQYRNLAAIQVASLGGVYAVSFLVILLNLGFMATIQRYIVRTDRRLSWHPEVVLPMMVLAAALGFGIQQLRAERVRAAAYTPLRASLVQPNISQYEKWDEAFAQEIVKKLIDLTLAAHGDGKSEVTIWPETAFPDHWHYERHVLAELLRRTDTPMLIGSIHYKPEELDNMEFQNGSFLFTPDDLRFVEDPFTHAPPTYNKQHLVLIGETIPFRKQLPILARLSPVPYFCIPGEESTLFQIGDVTASPLICFEDVMPYLSRNAVRNGARLLVNQTNDAWFDPFRLCDAHMPHAVFRAVEHRVPVIRSTNTGRSCAIDTTGLVSGALPRLEKTWGKVEVHVPPSSHALTLYGRIGDWPVRVAFVIGLASLVLLTRTRGSAT